jgi:hypothetical protein
MDWKHGVLTNGEKLKLPVNLLRMVLTMCFWASIMMAAEFVAWGLSSFLRTSARWISIVCSFGGGLALIAFSFWYARDFYFVHPIPLSSFIGGVLLFVKGVRAVFFSKIKRNLRH